MVFVPIAPSSLANDAAVDPVVQVAPAGGSAEKSEEVSGQGWASLQSALQPAKLRPSPSGVAGPDDEFGYSVAVEGNRALVGGIGLGSTGAAVVLEDAGSGWVEVATLRPLDGEPADQFGFAVSLSGDRALVGAKLNDASGTSSGSAYVFDFNGQDWSQTAKLAPNDGAAGDVFGHSVSLVGDRALIGAKGDNGGSGSAYVFELDGPEWVETAKLTAYDASQGDEFGFSVSLSGDRALIGAHRDDENGENSGSAYVFELDESNWSETAKLTVQDSQGDEFGFSVSLFGDRALIGAPRDDDNGGGSGAAYVFDLDGTSWNQTAKLAPDDGSGGDEFGSSVSLSGARALIGARRDDNQGEESGSAYLFDLEGVNWVETARLVPADAEARDRFGAAVSLADDRALVGANLDDDNGGDSGSAYVFDFDGPAQDWDQTAKLTPAEGSSFDWFGVSVSVDGGRALIGASRDRANVVDSGSAYVFDFDGTSWVKTAELAPADGASDDRFGTSVSLSGNRALIGASQDDASGEDSGSAYIFDFDGESWSETAKLTPADGAERDQFGISVSLSGDRALVGSFRDDDNGLSSGSAYVFDFNGKSWSQTDKLTPEDGSAIDEFGRSVSLFGDRALIGNYRDDVNGIASAGSAYVFDFDGTSWGETAKLTPGDGAEGDLFGISVSLSGDRALVGAYLDDAKGSSSGSAYVFDFDGTSWNETAKLAPADGAPGDIFGFSTSLSGNRALIGAHLVNANGSDSGSAYVFDFDGKNWNETVKLVPADGGIRDFLGFSVSLSGDRALVGAYGDDDNGTDSGSAYVYDFNEPPVAQDDDFTVLEDNVLNGNLFADNGNGIDTDPGGGGFEVQSAGTFTAAGIGGAVTTQTNGDFVYTPPANASGEAAFGYTIVDSSGATDSATVTIEVNAVDDPPVAVDDSANLDEDAPATAIGVLANDTDIDGGPIAIGSVTQPTVGTVAIAGDGMMVTYTPAADQCNDGNPPDDFSYTLAPGGASATVSVAVTCVNDAPTLSAGDPPAVDEDAGAQALPGWATFDPGPAEGGQSVLAYSVGNVSDPALFAAGPSLDAAGRLTYTPAADANGSSVFEVTVQDDGGTANGGSDTSDPKTFTITVTPVNDPPTFDNAGDVTEIEDADYAEPWASSIRPGPADESGQAVSFMTTVISNPSLFATGPAVDSTGNLTFTPAADTTGSAEIEVTAIDDGGSGNGGSPVSAPATLTIDVVKAADLSIDKVSGSFFTPPGGDVGYTITVSNAGPSDVTQAAVIDTPPARLGNVSWNCMPSGNADCNPSGTVEIDELVNLPEGANVTFRINAELTDTLNDPITNTVTVSSPAGVLELDSTNNSDSDTDVVGLFADGFESIEP